MKSCDKIWGKLEENRDDSQYGWVVISWSRVLVPNKSNGQHVTDPIGLIASCLLNNLNNGCIDIYSLHPK